MILNQAELASRRFVETWRKSYTGRLPEILITSIYIGSVIVYISPPVTAEWLHRSAGLRLQTMSALAHEPPHRE